jgi:cell division protein FtsB
LLLKGSLAVLLLLLIALQYKAWFGDAGHLANEALRAEVLMQMQRAEVLRARNRILTAEVLAWTNGLDAVEASARVDLGMIRADETFYLVGQLPKGRE